MPRMYRAMKRDGNKPLIRDSRVGLGVLIGHHRAGTFNQMKAGTLDPDKAECPYAGIGRTSRSV
jgi:hypothetical protein